MCLSLPHLRYWVLGWLAWHSAVENPDLSSG
jgi:hypothetical protein